MALKTPHLRKSASLALALSFKQVFPFAVYLESGLCASGFYCTFSFPQTFQPPFLSLVKEKMMQLIALDLPFKSFSMMRENAAEYLMHRGMPNLAQKALRQRENILQITELAEIIELNPFSFVNSTKPLKFFDLLDFEQIGDVLRIQGCVFCDRSTCARFKKAWEKRKKHAAPLLANEMELARPMLQSWVWLDRGIKILHALQNWERNLFCQGGFEQTSFAIPAGDLERVQRHLDGRPWQVRAAYQSLCIARHTGRRKIFSSFTAQSRGGASFYQQAFPSFYQGFFCLDVKELVPSLISLLHIIRQILKIFTFEFQVVLSLPASAYNGEEAKAFCEAVERAEWKNQVRVTRKAMRSCHLQVYWIDGLARRHPGPSLRLYLQQNVRNLFQALGWNKEKEKGQQEPSFYMGAFSFMGLQQKWIAYLLEETQGDLPLWLAPCHLALIASSAFHKKAQEVQAFFAQQGLRCEIELLAGSLAACIRRVGKRKVPYAVFIGLDDGTSMENMISVRALKTNKRYTISAKDFSQQLLALMEEERAKFTLRGNEF